MEKQKKISILFVCMGNICRSPTAEGVVRHYLLKAGVADAFLLDSAGTLDHHVGSPPDQRTQQAALHRGYDLSALRARQVCAEDFQVFDRLLAMDLRNLAWLREHCPKTMRAKLGLFLDFAEGYEGQEVPDPYYGGSGGFERVLDMVEAAAEGLIRAYRPWLVASGVGMAQVAG